MSMVSRWRNVGTSGRVPKNMRKAGLALLLLTTALPAAAGEVRHTFQSSVARGEVRRVVIDVPAADVDIRNNAGDKLAVSGWISRDPDSDRNRDKEQRIVDDTSIAIEVKNDEATVRRHFGPRAQSWRAGMFSSYHVTVEVPPGMSLDVQTQYGDITIEGSFGDIDVDLRAGDIDVRIPKKDVRQLNASARVGEVRTKLGDEIVQREGVFPGKTRYENPEGRTIVNVHVTAGDVNVILTP